VKTKVSPAIVGAFALGAFALGIIALLAFGGVNFFSKPQRFVVYFDESIHGLDLGSPVKLRGVRVGRVADLTVRYDERKNHSVVVVTCEFSRNTLTDSKGALINVSEREELQTLIDHGLRAQLGVLGLATGLLFVELDFLNPTEYPADSRTTEIKYAVVPAVPSAISEFQASASEILSKIRKIDFEGLTGELKKLLADTRRQVDGLDLKGVSAQWQRTGAAIETLATSPNSSKPSPTSTRPWSISAAHWPSSTAKSVQRAPTSTRPSRRRRKPSRTSTPPRPHCGASSTRSKGWARAPARRLVSSPKRPTRCSGSRISRSATRTRC